MRFTGLCLDFGISVAAIVLSSLLTCYIEVGTSTATVVFLYLLTRIVGCGRKIKNSYVMELELLLLCQIQ